MSLILEGKNEILISGKIYIENSSLLVLPSFHLTSCWKIKFLEKEIRLHVCGFPFMPLPWGLQTLGEALEMSGGLCSWKPSFHHKEKIYLITGEGNGSPLQYSCLENPMDRGAWWATVHGVAKRRTQLKRFSTRAQRLRETVSSLSQEERPNWELALSEPWSWGFTLQNYEKANVCCLSHLAYGILLWKVEQFQGSREFQG